MVGCGSVTHRDFVESEIGEPTVGLRPGPERVEHLAAEQRREMVPLGKDHKVIAAANSPHNVRDGIGMPIESGKLAR
jgi:hypothetical protein